MLASQKSGWFEGMVLLLFYSLGLGVPFVLSALLIDSLKGAFDFIKRHYRVINIVCGVFLIIYRCTYDDRVIQPFNFIYLDRRKVNEQQLNSILLIVIIVLIIGGGYLFTGFFRQRRISASNRAAAPRLKPLPTSPCTIQTATRLSFPLFQGKRLS